MGFSVRRHNIGKYDFERLPAGGYVCKIVSCEFGTNKNGQDMIFLNVDIAEGEFAGYFQKRYDRFNKWSYAAIFKRKIFGTNGEDLADSFQQLLEDIEDSNAFQFNDSDINESDFVGKICGFIFGDKEYQKKDGTTDVNAQITFSISVRRIREGKFKIPPIKKLTPQPQQTTETQNKQERPSDAIIDPDSGELIDPPFE